jgi:hypothetical protein
VEYVTKCKKVWGKPFIFRLTANKLARGKTLLPIKSSRVPKVVCDLGIETIFCQVGLVRTHDSVRVVV